MTNSDPHPHEGTEVRAWGECPACDLGRIYVVVGPMFGRHFDAAMSEASEGCRSVDTCRDPGGCGAPEVCFPIGEKNSIPDHQDWDEPCQHREAWEGVRTHTPTVNGIGPDHCQECSEAIQEWVQYPCPRVTTPGQDGVV